VSQVWGAAAGGCLPLRTRSVAADPAEPADPPTTPAPGARPGDFRLPAGADDDGAASAEAEAAAAADPYVRWDTVGPASPRRARVSRGAAGRPVGRPSAAPCARVVRYPWPPLCRSAGFRPLCRCLAAARPQLGPQLGRCLVARCNFPGSDGGWGGWRTRNRLGQRRGPPAPALRATGAGPAGGPLLSPLLAQDIRWAGVWPPLGFLTAIRRQVGWTRLKGLDRAAEKAAGAYGGDPARLLDVCRQAPVPPHTPPSHTHPAPPDPDPARPRPVPPAPPRPVPPRMAAVRPPFGRRLGLF
jgi:hypothetical protein